MKLKLGTESPVKVAVAVVLLLIGVFFAVRGFNSSTLPESMALNSPPVQPALGGKTQLLPENNLDPRLRLDLLKNSEDVQYKGNGRNIFRAGAEPPKELPKPVQNPLGGGPAEAGKNAGAPPTPTINLKYFGFENRQGVQKRVFLAEGDNVFVAEQGDIVNRRYRILRISPTSVEVEDVVGNVKQTLPLTQG